MFGVRPRTGSAHHNNHNNHNHNNHNNHNHSGDSSDNSEADSDNQRASLLAHHHHHGADVPRASGGGQGEEGTGRAGSDGERGEEGEEGEGAGREEGEEGEEEGEDGKRYVPWYLVLIPPLYVGAPALTRRQWLVLRLVGLAGLFRSYDSIILTVSLQSIQHDLAIADDHVAFVTSLIQLGAVLALPLAVYADVHGRRLALLLTIGPFTMLTFVTALVPSGVWFAVVQFAAKAFCMAEFVIAQARPPTANKEGGRDKEGRRGMGDQGSTLPTF